jgi:hypothetical protein
MAINSLDPVVALTPQPAPGQPGAPAQPKNSLYEKAGGDWNKAAESYFNAVSKIGELHNQNQALTDRAQQLSAMLAPVVNGGQPAVTDPLARLQSEFGLPSEPFAEAIDSRVKSGVQSALEALLGPIVKDMEASEKLSAEVENFDTLKGEARKFMAGNPEVLETFNAVRTANPVAAWKYAIREAMTAKGTRPAPSTHAGLPGGMTPQGRGPVNPVADATREGEALEYGRAYNDMAPYRHERFKGTSVERAVKAALRQAGLPVEEENRGW